MADIKSTSQEFAASGSLNEVRKAVTNTEPVDYQETIQFLAKKIDQLVTEVNKLKNQ